MQVASSEIEFATAEIDTTSVAFSNTPTVSKLFASEGFSSFYTFTLKFASDLSQFSKIYIEFPYGIAPGLNAEGYLECYLRVTGFSLVNTVCNITSERRIQVWINIIIAANT